MTLTLNTYTSLLTQFFICIYQILGYRLQQFLNNHFPTFYAPNFEKVWDILVSACPCVCVCVCVEGGGHGDIVLKLHVWIPHGKIGDAYFWFSLNYLPLLIYGPLTNEGMKFC